MSKAKAGKYNKKAQKTVEDESPRYFLNPESVSRHLYCSICQEVFVEPMRAPCGHSYCKKCIMQWLKSSKTCPEDRKAVTPGSLHHDFILENIIGDQMVACPFRYSGCEFVGQLERLSSHKNECDFNPKNLPEFLRERTDGDVPITDVTMMGDVMPSPAKPSLMMRLYRGGNDRKRLLSTMFDDKENSPSNSIIHIS